MRPAALLHYLALPLHLSPLLLIVIFAVLLTGAEFSGLFGLPTFVVLGSWFFKYGFNVLDYAIDGREEPPVFSPEMANPVEQRPMGLMLILIAIYAITGSLRNLLGETTIDIVRLLLMAAIPAMIAAISITGRIRDAVNPVAVFGTIARIPVAYASLLGLIAGFWLFAGWVMHSADYSLTDLWRKESFLPGQLIMNLGLGNVLPGMLRLMLMMYLWLAMFACIGGTIYEQRLELGFDPAHSPERKAARQNAELDKERDKIMDRLFAEVRGGAFSNAGESVRKEIEASANPLDECRWLYARARAAASQALANYIAEITLPRLLSAGATGEALEMLRDRLQHGDFRPATGGQLLRLAQLARTAGDRPLARQLLGDFETRYPNDSAQAMAIKLRCDLN